MGILNKIKKGSTKERFGKKIHKEEISKQINENRIVLSQYPLI